MSNQQVCPECQGTGKGVKYDVNGYYLKCNTYNGASQIPATQQPSEFEQVLQAFDDRIETLNSIEGPGTAEVLAAHQADVDREVVSVLEELDLPEREKDCDSTDHEYSWAMGFDDAVQAMHNIINQTITRRLDTKNKQICSRCKGTKIVSACDGCGCMSLDHINKTKPCEVCNNRDSL